VIAGAPSKDISAYEKFLSEKVHLVFGQTYDLFHAAEAGWVTSGTATLEAAIHNMPQVVVYKAGTISYQIARRLVKVKYISLVNLIMDKEVVTELIQGEATAANLISEMKLILKSGSKRNKLLTEYEELNHALGHEGASKKAATHMLKTLADSK
jgi:lipid-A-disaccharide synthase